MWGIPTDIPTDIELRHLRAFVAVGEELNFTAAAKRLFIAQQALSTQIRQLEKRLGVQLLYRTTRTVELTEAGRVFYPSACAILSDMEGAVSAVRCATNSREVMSIGFAAPIDHCLIRRGMNQWAETQAELRIVHGDPLDPSGGLREGGVDVAFVFGPFDDRGLQLVTLFAEPLGVAMARDHPLAGERCISLEQVVAEPTFWFPTPDEMWRDFWEAAAHRNGDGPVYVGEYRSLDALLSIVSSGRGVRVATEQLVGKLGEPAGVVWKPVPELGTVEHSIAKRVGDHRPGITDFLDHMEEVFSA